MSELLDFLRAQLDEDERVARSASPGPWKPNAEHDEVLAVNDERVADGFALSGRQLRATVEHIARHDPARVLAEVDAKRRILNLHRTDDEGGADPICNVCLYVPPCETLRALALPYADRPGYRSEWAS